MSSYTLKKNCDICKESTNTKMCTGCKFVVCSQHAASHLNYTKCCTCGKMGCQLTMHNNYCMECYNKGMPTSKTSKCCSCGKITNTSNLTSNYCTGCFKQTFKYHYEPQKCCTCNKMVYELAGKYCVKCYRK